MRRVGMIVLLALIFIDAVFLVIMTGGENFDTVPTLDANELYRIVNTELIPREEVSTFCVTDSVLALFYESQGLVNIYSLEGSFLYGLQVITLRNGIGDIAVEDDYLYIKPRGNRIFVFKEKELIRSFLYSEDSTEYRRIEQILNRSKNHVLNDETYHYLSETNQIIKHTPQGATVSVVTMPDINSDTQILGMLLLLLIAALVHYLRFSKPGGGSPSGGQGDGSLVI